MSTKPLMTTTTLGTWKPPYFDKLPYTVLIGKVGTGKSTIVENLNKSSGLSEECGESCTQSTHIYMLPKFFIADTPGVNAKKKKLDHAMSLLCALRFQKVSRIFVTCKFQNRVEAMEEDIELIIPIFQKTYLNHITILVTHWDAFESLKDEKKPKVKKLIDEMFSKFNVKSILYSGKNSCVSESQLEETFTLAQPVDTSFETKDITKFFVMREEGTYIIDSIQQKVKEFDELYKSVIEYEKCLFGNEKNDFLLYSELALTVTASNFLKDFKAQHNFESNIPEEALSINDLNSQISSILRKFNTYCKTYQIYYYGCDKEDEKHPFRKCNHCGQVFIKVEGCNGPTRCGARPSTKDEAFYKWNWRIENGKFHWSKEEKDKNKSEVIVENLFVELEKYSSRVGAMIESGKFWMFDRRLRLIQRDIHILLDSNENSLSLPRFLRHIEKMFDDIIKPKERKEWCCGRPILWRTMEIVEVPEEFKCELSVNLPAPVPVPTLDDINNQLNNTQIFFEQRIGEL